MFQHELLEGTRIRRKEIKRLTEAEQALNKQKYELKDLQVKVEEEYINEHAKFKKFAQFIHRTGELVSIRDTGILWEGDEERTFSIEYTLQRTGTYEGRCSEEELLQKIADGEYRIKSDTEKQFVLGQTILLHKVSYHKTEGEKHYFHGVSERKGVMLIFTSTYRTIPQFENYHYPFFLKKGRYGSWYLRRYTSSAKKEWTELMTVTLEKCVIGKEEMVIEML